jgi:fatty acid desaturase
MIYNNRAFNYFRHTIESIDITSDPRLYKPKQEGSNLFVSDLAHFLVFESIVFAQVYSFEGSFTFTERHLLLAHVSVALIYLGGIALMLFWKFWSYYQFRIISVLICLVLYVALNFSHQAWKSLAQFF